MARRSAATLSTTLRGPLLALVIAPVCACTFPDVTYAGGGGAGGATSSVVDAANCTSTVPADCTCPGTCTLPHASASCSGAACAIDACASGFADCNHDPADGCEADLQNDELDCGSCATACTAPAQCKKGKCK